MTITIHDPATRDSTKSDRSRATSKGRGRNGGAHRAESVRGRFHQLLGSAEHVEDAPPASCLDVVDARTGKPADNPDGRARGRLASALGLQGARIHFDGRTRSMFAVLMIIVAVAAAGAAWVAWPKSQPAPAMAAAHAEDSDDAETSIVLTVVGDVVEPGLVEVPAGSRVADAVEAAGGLGAETESAGYLNLARQVSDGELIVVDGDSDPAEEPADSDDPADSDEPADSDDPSDSDEPADSDDPADSDEPTGSGDGPLNINDASESELTTVTGIGPVTAANIVEYREQNGGFDSVDQLTEVSGIGDATLDSISDQVTV